MQTGFPLTKFDPISSDNKRITFIKTKSKQLIPTKLEKKIQRSEPQSFLSMYADRFNHVSSLERANTLKKIQKNKQHSMDWKDSTLPLYTMDKKNVNNQRVQNTINFINSYNHELKSTFLHKSKSKTKQEYVPSKNIKMEFHSLKKLPKDHQVVDPETIKPANPLLTKYQNKSIAFKTINVLYRAIIDNTIQKRRKQEFQIHANKLPIINRFRSHRKRHPPPEQVSQDLPIQEMKTKSNLLFRTVTKEKTFVPTKKRLKNRQQGQILPWNFDEEEESY